MTACPSKERLAAQLDGETSANDSALIQTHVASCARCAAETAGMTRARTALGAIAVPRDNPAQVARIMQALDQPRRTPARALAWAAATSLCVLAIVVSQKNDNFVARGGTTLSDQGLRVFAAATPGGPAVEVHGDTRADAILSFSVFRSQQSAKETMIFAVDSAGEVHWFYPTYTDAARPPSSAQLDHTGWALLPEAVRMEGAKPGPATFYLLTGAAATDVKQIEARVHGTTFSPPEGARVSSLAITLH